MNGMTVAVVSYIIAIIISFFVAGLIQIIGSILNRFSKDTPSEGEMMNVESSENIFSDDAAVAAAIVIAKQNI